MKKVLILFLTLISSISHGQICDTIDGQKINCIDKNGQKQGYWKNKRYIAIHDPRYLVLSEGEYVDNKEKGTWKYYSDNDHLIYMEKEITFYESGSTKERNIIDNSIIELIKDSSEILGYIKYKNDTINFNCANSLCLFQLTNSESIVEFKYTNYNNFDFEILRLRMGMYDRIISAKKTNR